MKNLKILLNALAVVPLLIASASALYDTVQKIDDDPEIKAAFDKFKNEPKIAETIQTIKVQVAVIRSQLKQLT